MKRKSNQNILTIALLTLFIVVTWLGFDIYRSIHKPTLSKILEKQIKKLQPEFDTKTLNNLKQRKRISQKELTILKEPIKEASPSTEIE